MFSFLREWVLANALLIALAAAALATTGFVVQTIRIEGLRVDLPLLPAFGPKGFKAEIADLETQLDLMRAQRDAAARIKLQTEAANARATEKANTDVETNLQSQRDRADRFIAAGGVRPCPARTTVPAEDRGAGVDAAAGALPVVDVVRPDVVTVLPEDVRICTENTVKARAWQAWGLEIEENHEAAE